MGGMQRGFEKQRAQLHAEPGLRVACSFEWFLLLWKRANNRRLQNTEPGLESLWSNSLLLRPSVSSSSAETNKPHLNVLRMKRERGSGPELTPLCAAKTRSTRVGARARLALLLWRPGLGHGPPPPAFQQRWACALSPGHQVGTQPRSPTALVLEGGTWVYTGSIQSPFPCRFTVHLLCAGFINHYGTSAELNQVGLEGQMAPPGGAPGAGNGITSLASSLKTPPRTSPNREAKQPAQGHTAPPPACAVPTVPGDTLLGISIIQGANVDPNVGWPLALCEETKAQRGVGLPQ